MYAVGLVVEIPLSFLKTRMSHAGFLRGGSPDLSVLHAGVRFLGCEVANPDVLAGFHRACEQATSPYFSASSHGFSRPLLNTGLGHMSPGAE